MLGSIPWGDLKCNAIGSQIVSASHRPPVVCNFGWAGFIHNFGRDIQMGKLVLRRKPGESIRITHRTDKEAGVILITQRQVGSGRAFLEFEAPEHYLIVRSELIRSSANENKYYSLGPDPIAAIKSIGFTREVGRFGVIAYVHESLPLDMRHHGSQEGWVCVYGGERVVHKPDSFASLAAFAMAVALDELRKRGAK